MRSLTTASWQKISHVYLVWHKASNMVHSMSIKFTKVVIRVSLHRLVWVKSTFVHHPVRIALTAVIMLYKMNFLVWTRSEASNTRPVDYLFARRRNHFRGPYFPQNLISSINLFLCHSILLQWQYWGAYRQCISFKDRSVRVPLRGRQENSISMLKDVYRIS